MKSDKKRDIHVEPRRVHEIILLLETYLKEKLLPFWLENSIDEKYGGFLSYFDRNGKPTGKTDKTLICQLRMIFTLASAHRAGYGEGRCLEAAKQGVEFTIEHFWDKEYEGWTWITDRQGRVIHDSKIMYGQSFGVYSMAEYALASGEPVGRAYAEKTFNTIQRNATDTYGGGYWEMFHRDWSLKPGGVYGGDRKTLDVHMHLMEAFTVIYEMSGIPIHARKLREIIRILIERMLDHEFGTGVAQFDEDFEPLPAIIFQTCGKICNKTYKTA